MYHYGGACSGSLTPRLRKVQRQRHIPPTSQLKKLSLSLCNLVNRSCCGGEWRHSRRNRRGRGHRCPHRHRRDNRCKETSLARRNRSDNMKGGENLGHYTPYFRSCESLGQTAPQGCLAASRAPEVARHRQEPGEIQPGFLRQVLRQTRQKRTGGRCVATFW